MAIDIACCPYRAGLVVFGVANRFVSMRKRMAVALPVGRLGLQPFRHIGVHIERHDTRWGGGSGTSAAVSSAGSGSCSVPEIFSL